MHRFMVETETLSNDRSVWLQPQDSTAWRCLVDSFRQSIKARAWRLIDLNIRLMVTISHEDGQAVLIEDLASRSDYYVASAYLRAAILEGSTIMVHAEDTLPWSQLRQFAAKSRRQHCHKGRALGHDCKAASDSAPAMATQVRHPEPRSVATRIRRTGRHETSAGDSLVQPKVHQGDCRGKDSTRQHLRLTGRSTMSTRSRSPEPDDQSAGLVAKSAAEPSSSI